MDQSTLGLSVIKKKKKVVLTSISHVSHALFESVYTLFTTRNRIVMAFGLYTIYKTKQDSNSITILFLFVNSV